MSFQGITFDGQNVSPKDDGALYGCHYGDGIIDGCGMTIGGNNDTLVIQSGHIIAGGRQCKVNGATELDLSAIANTTTYVQVYLQYDVSQPEGEQWDWGYNEQAALPFGALTQEDINGVGNIYQAELAILEASNSNLTGFYSSMSGSHYEEKAPNGSILKLYSDSAGGGIRRFDANGNPNGGIVVNDPSTTPNISTNIYGDGRSVFIRPNGLTDDTGRFCVYSNGDILVNGQQIGGNTIYNGTHSGSSISVGGNVTINTITDLPSGTYIGFGYFRGTPSTSGSNGTTDIFLELNGSAIVIDEIQGNTAVPRYRTVPIAFYGSGTLSLRVWSSSAYGWNSIGSALRLVRVG